MLAREPSRTTGSVRWADHEFSTPRTRSQEGSQLTAVELAARRGSADGVRVLLAHGLTIPSVGASSALVAAASNAAEDVIAVLLDAGVDVNGRDRRSDSALAMARRVDNAALVKLLLARGARE